MTPLIDIVFLLIVFFLVVCQFIDAENFPVSVPDDCDYAQGQVPGQPVTTVTVAKTASQASIFAVDAERVDLLNRQDMVAKMSELIDERLSKLPQDKRVVTLRIDREVCFADAQYALAAVAASTATDVKLAALKDKWSK